MTDHPSKTLLVLLPSWKPGGADRTYLGPIIPTAVEAGWQVHTACSGRADLEPLAHRLESLGATHHQCEIAEEHCTGLRYRLQQNRFRRNTLALLDSVAPDAVLLVLPWSTHGLGVMRACDSRGIPTATVFQLVRTSHPPRWRRRATRALLGNCCHPIAVSENNRGILTSLFDIEANRIALIHNGIDVEPDPTSEIIAEMRREIRRTLGLEDRHVLCLTTARLAPQKGHCHLVDALPRVIARYPEAHFAFAGEGQERAAIEARVRELDLATHVHLLGERRDIDALSRAADLFVFPTLFEGSPFALVEAMGRGLPIVTTDASGISEVVRNDREGLVVPKANPEALANAILEAMAAPERMQTLAARARERAKLFSGRSMADRTIEMLDSIRVRK